MNGMAYTADGFSLSAIQAIQEEANRVYLYLEPVVIPAYDSGDATHLLITTANGEWNSANFDVDSTYRHFYVEAGNYGSTKMNLEIIGTELDPVTMSLHNGNDTHPASLADNEQANAYFELRGNYWTIDRMSFLGIHELQDPALRLISEASNNIINRWHCRDFKYGFQIYNRTGSGFGYCHNNTLQKSYIHDQIDVVGTAVSTYDGIAVNIMAIHEDEVDVIITSNNKVVSNDIKNASDGFQTTRGSDNGSDRINGEGTIVYDNNIWLDDKAYRDGTGALDPLGEYSVTEEPMDLKFGSENASNPMIIEKNRTWGYRTIYPANQFNPSSIFAHFGVRNFKWNSNIMFDTGAGFGFNTADAWEAKNNIIFDTNNVNPENMSADGVYFSDAINGEFSNNTIIQQSSPGDAINALAQSASNTLNNNVLISTDDTNLLGTNTADNTWYYNHANRTLTGGTNEHTYTTEAEANMGDLSFQYERYTGSPLTKTLVGIISTDASPHYGIAGSDIK